MKDEKKSKTPGTPEPKILADDMMPVRDLKREVRTYLDTIIGYLDLLREDAAEKDEGTLSPELEQIWIASNELAALIEEH